MAEDPIKNLLQGLVGLTEEDWLTFQEKSRGVHKFFEKIADVVAYRIVAEVVESRYCAAGVKVGQRIVIQGGALVPQESTAPLCMRALAPLTGFVNTILEKIVAGEDPNDRVFMAAECLDPGLEAGGLGKVKFLVRAERVA